MTQFFTLFLYPPFNPSGWGCLNAEIEKVERQSMLDRARVCTELSNHLFHNDLEGEVSFSTLESGSGKQKFKEVILSRKTCRFSDCQCPRPGVVQTRPCVYSDPPHFRMRVTVALQVRIASSLLRTPYCVPLCGEEPSALSTRL